MYNNDNNKTQWLITIITNITQIWYIKMFNHNSFIIILIQSKLNKLQILRLLFSCCSWKLIQKKQRWQMIWIKIKMHTFLNSKICICWQTWSCFICEQRLLAYSTPSRDFKYKLQYRATFKHLWFGCSLMGEKNLYKNTKLQWIVTDIDQLINQMIEMITTYKFCLIYVIILLRHAISVVTVWEYVSAMCFCC